MINGELIVDNFAGGGGASTGIEMATGISVDIAINHDPEAIRMHKVNHPSTKHYCESVWNVDPVKACKGRPVALAWFSPDCKHFSKAKGGKPKDKNIRGLAWVALRWAGLVRPRVIMLENVEEFKTWGPLNRGHRPIKAKQGVTFKKFISQFEELGYKVEFRELVAADYGAPTMRKRFFLIARCDGKPIVWPEPTHAPADSEEVKAGLLKPYIGAYTQLDFSLPCPSIFDTAEEIKEKYGIRAVRPLAPKTMERIARGLKKFVIDNAEPFIVQVNHSGAKSDYCKSANEPLSTITGKHGFGIVEPKLAPIIDKTYGGNYLGGGSKVDEPLDTITTVDHNRLVEAKLQMVDNGAGFPIDRMRYPAYCNPEEMDKLPFADPKMEKEIQEQLIVPFMGTNTTNHPGGSCKEPIHTITTGNQQCLISPMLIQCHSETSDKEVRGQAIENPIMTVDGSNRYALVENFLNIYYRKTPPKDLCELQGLPNEILKDDVSRMKKYPLYPHPMEQELNPPKLESFRVGASCLIQMNNHCDGKDIKEPIPTITAGDGHFGEVRAFLERYDVYESNRCNKRTDRPRNNTCEKRRKVLEDIEQTVQRNGYNSCRPKENGSEFEIGISRSGRLEERKTVFDACTQSNVGVICRNDTGRNGYQSQEWEQEGQQVGKSGSSNAKSKSYACDKNRSENLQQLSGEVFGERERIAEQGDVVFTDRKETGDISDSCVSCGEFQAHTLIKYYGQGTGQDIKEPLDTITAQDRFGLVTIEGVDYQIVDIGLRMLEPKELYGCQGFPDDYIIDHDYTGKSYPRNEQVRRCGNAVCPPIPAALVKANLPECCIAERVPNMKIAEDRNGQLKFA